MNQDEVTNICGEKLEGFTSIDPEIDIFWHVFYRETDRTWGSIDGNIDGKILSLRFGGAQRRPSQCAPSFWAGREVWHHQASLRGSVLGTRTTHCTDLHSCTRENNINVLCASRLDKCAIFSNAWCPFQRDLHGLKNGPNTLDAETSSKASLSRIM